jgi:predicted nucleotide-binding protein
MKLDRKKVTISKVDKNELEKPCNLSGAEAMSYVWELTKEVYSLSGKYDVESRLQRYVVTVIRKTAK